MQKICQDESGKLEEPRDSGSAEEGDYRTSREIVDDEVPM